MKSTWYTDAGPFSGLLNRLSSRAGTVRCPLARQCTYSNHTFALRSSHALVATPRLGPPAAAEDALALNDADEPGVNHFAHEDEYRGDGRRNGNGPALVHTLAICNTKHRRQTRRREDTHKYQMPF